MWSTEGGGDQRSTTPTPSNLPPVAASPRAKTHAQPLGPSRCSLTSSLLRVTAHVQLFTASPSQINTDSGALRRRSNGEGTEWFQEDGVENPLRGLLMRRRNHTRAVSTPQHSLELRTLLHRQAECACSASPRRPLSFFCACATVIPHSRPTPNPHKPGREGRELLKGGKGSWSGGDERLLTPWLLKGKAAAASAEERRWERRTQAW